MSEQTINSIPALPQKLNDEDRLLARGKTISRYFVLDLAFGLISILIFALVKSLSFLNVFSGSMMVGGASTVFGILLGFLFGIPKTKNASTNIVSASQGTDDKTDEKYYTNTALEEISDWLTKVLVGASLTQISVIGEAIQRIVHYLSISIGIGMDSSGFIWAALMYYVISGFIYGYVITRLFFPYISKISDIAMKSLSNIRDIANKVVNMSKDIVSLNSKINDVNESSTIVQSMYDALYAPNGYLTTIRLGEEYIAKVTTVQDVNFWIYLAAGYGQSYFVDPSEETRKKALDAVKKALETDKSVALPALRYLWDPELHKSADKESEDNDLEVFFSDPDFIEFLGEDKVQP